MDKVWTLSVKFATFFNHDKNSHFALDFHEEVPEVRRGGGQYHLVGVKRAAPAACERHISQIVAAENVSRQSGIYFKDDK